MPNQSPPVQDKAPGQERIFATLALLPVAALMLFVLLEGSVSLRAFVKLAGAYVGISLMIVASAFVCFAAVELVRAGKASRWQTPPTRAIGAAVARRWREDRLLTLAWPMAAFMLLMPSFNAFKQRILPDAGFVYDAELAAIDRALFGVDPGLWLHRTIGSPATTQFFDAIYHSWFVPTTMGLCIAGLCATPRTRAQYMLAYIGVWIVLGALLAYLIPAAGPAFYEALVDPSQAAPFRAVQDQLAATGSSGGFLTSLHNQAYLLRSLGAPDLAVGGGISAIPSVHNAIAVLFALAGFRIHPLCGIAASVFAVLIWVASVYLNWHYAIDGLVGAAGAAALWYGAGALVDRILGTADRAAADGRIDTWTPATVPIR